MEYAETERVTSLTVERKIEEATAQRCHSESNVEN
jgi:hypothetical protein